MLTLEDFIAAGYCKFTGYTGHNLSDFGLQKLVSDGTGKRYHITVSVYDNSRYARTHPDYFNQKPWSLVPHVQFELCDTITANIEFLITEETTILQIEEYFHHIWTRINCEYYERFEE